MCVSVLVFMHMPCICLPLCGFFCVLENLSKSSPLKSLLWHIISPCYKGNLSKLKLKGKERGGGLGIGVVGEIPVSSVNISCPRVLVASAGVLTHQDPSTPCFSLSLAFIHTHLHTWLSANTQSFWLHPHTQTSTFWRMAVQICTNIHTHKNENSHWNNSSLNHLEGIRRCCINKSAVLYPYHMRWRKTAMPC